MKLAAIQPNEASIFQCVIRVERLVYHYFDRHRVSIITRKKKQRKMITVFIETVCVKDGESKVYYNNKFTNLLYNIFNA